MTHTGEFTAHLPTMASVIFTIVDDHLVSAEVVAHVSGTIHIDPGSGRLLQWRVSSGLNYQFNSMHTMTRKVDFSLFRVGFTPDPLTTWHKVDLPKEL